MKIKTTAKAIRNSYEDKIAISYCGAQYLLWNHTPVAYTCGIYGWNFDVYSVDGVLICTGYRGMVGKTPDYAMLNEYENMARRVVENRKMSYEDKQKAVESLLHEFITKVA